MYPESHRGVALELHAEPYGGPWNPTRRPPRITRTPVAPPLSPSYFHASLAKGPPCTPTSKIQATPLLVVRLSNLFAICYAIFVCPEAIFVMMYQGSEKVTLCFIFSFEQLEFANSWEIKVQKVQIWITPDKSHTLRWSSMGSQFERPLDIFKLL